MHSLQHAKNDKRLCFFSTTLSKTLIAENKKGNRDGAKRGGYYAKFLFYLSPVKHLSLDNKIRSITQFLIP